MKSLNLKKFLLAGTAIVAVGSFAAGAQAADVEITGTTAAPNDITGLADADVIVNATDSNTPDAAYVDVNGNDTVASINIDENAILGVFDSNATAEDTLTVTTYADIESGNTLTLVLGSAEADGTGTDGAGAFTVAIGTTLGDAGATTLTRGGTLAIVGAADESNGAETASLTVGGNTLMTTVSVTGGAGGNTAGEAGTAVSATFGDASSDTFNVTGFSVTGGAANAASDVAGGASTGNVTGTATIGAGNLAITGGAAADDAAGGAASSTFTGDLTISGGAVTVTGGADAAAAAAHGGDASLTVTGDVTSDGALTLTTGAEAASGGGLSGDATATFGGDVTFTAMNLNDLGDGVVTITFNSTDAATITGDIDGVGGAEGSVLITGAGALTFNDKVGDDTGDGIAVLTIDGSANTTVTFKDDIDATTFTVGGGATADTTNTVTFDTSTQSFEVVTALVAADGTEVDALTVSGGNTLTQTAAWGAGNGIDTLTISGSGTIFDSNAALSATDGDATITVGSGAKLDVGAGLVTATTLANSGTVQLTGTGGVTADITGSGTLDVDQNATVTGSIANSVDVADNVQLTIDATSGNETVSGAIVINDSGTDDGLIFAPQANTITVSGAITTATADQGEIIIQDTGAVTFSGGFGTATKEIGLFEIGDATANAAATVTTSLYATATTIDDGSILTLTGNGVVVSGTVDAGAQGADNGNIVIGDDTNAASVTFQGLIGSTADLDSITINSSAEAIFAAAGNNGFDGGVDLDGTAQVNSGVTFEVADAYDSDGDAEAGRWELGVKRTSGTTSIGRFVTGGALDLSADTVHFIVESGSQPLAAEVIAAASGGFTAGGANTTAATVTDNSYLYDFALTDNGNNFDVTISAANTIAATSANSGQSATGTKLLTTLAASTNTQINQLQSQLQAQSTAGGVQDTLEAAASDMGAGAVSAGVSIANQTSGITNARLAALRSGEASGMAAGDMASGVKAWGQAFGKLATQDKRDGVSGYDADTYGLSVGLDTENLSDDMTIGLAFSYADTEVDSDAVSNAKTEIDSYQLSLYGDYDLDDVTYVSGQLGYIWGKNDTTRNPGGISTLTATGDYDSETWVAGVEVGRDYARGNGVTLTPSVSATYMHYSADSYTETGAGGANLTVDSDSLDLFEIGLGVDASWISQNADGSYLKPTLSAGVRHDVIGDSFEATNQFSGGGTAFNVEGFDPAQTTFDLGAGVTYYSTDNWEFSANYDFEIKSDYDAHAAALKASYKF